MTIHMSARLAWHMNGWNGRVCDDPKSNVYCIGLHSYPGEMIAASRDLAYEQEKCGCECGKLEKTPPCVYSINAFGSKAVTAYADPPDFFHGEATKATWPLKRSTVCLWPYELMYGDDVSKAGGGYDNDKRLKNAREYFTKFEPNKSLIFYYSNYSNPLNQQDERRYAVVGVSRIKEIGKIRFYDDCSERVRERYGGGFIWQCDVTSHYPDEGLRIPYHLYLQKPEILDKISFYPDNPRLFKFATREVQDDDALDLVERFLELAGTLREIGDTSEDWTARINWLQSLIVELWDGRGLYPGMAAVLEVLGFNGAIKFWRDQAQKGKETEAKDALFAVVEGRKRTVPGLSITDLELQGLSRQWKLREDDERKLLKEILPRFHLGTEQIKKILSTKRAANGINSSLSEIAANPYILSEEFTGDNADDMISFGKIDHGTLPSPALGGESLVTLDDWRRLRALAVERLRRESKHTFVAAEDLIHDINHKLSLLPEWKRHQFTERYLEVDETELTCSLTFRTHEGKKYVYWRPVYEAEREIEDQVRRLAARPNISFRSPVTSAHWNSFLTQSKSVLAEKAPREYREAIQGQVEVCQRIFVRPITVLSGAAGTGKTTVIESLIKAIEKAHGTGTSFILLAPTGKAADRIRAKTKKPAMTIHSFLAKKGWLNPNLTFKRSGGLKESEVQTIIVDEASMLDLEMAATLFRAVDWDGAVQRLILVGDPNQLPPIGRGKVFAEIIDWLEADQPESLAFLATNMRQMENRVTGRGRGILDLAALYLRRELQFQDREQPKVDAETFLAKIQEGGDVDKDLRVIYWSDPDDLSHQLIEVIIKEMEEDTGRKFSADRPFDLWNEACKDDKQSENYRKRPDYLQVLSPYRGEMFGTDILNVQIQKHVHGLQEQQSIESQQNLDGIMLFDKVIQIRNRSLSEPICAYNIKTREAEWGEVFNGELGFVKPHAFDGKKWKWQQSSLKHFQVVFARKEDLWFGYGEELGKGPNGKYLHGEKVEENLELAYCISVHKAQGSDFERTYLIVPKHKTALLSPELLYTGLTRATRHCTLFVEQDIAPLLKMRRREQSHLLGINSSLFIFMPLPKPLMRRDSWYEDKKIYATLAGYMVQSKSEVIIANLLADREIKFEYSEPLYAEDGTFYLPDFSITWRGEKWYWEHWGLMDKDSYRNHTATKKQWYQRFFPGRLVETYESPDLTTQAEAIIKKHFS